MTRWERIAAAAAIVFTVVLLGWLAWAAWLHPAPPPVGTATELKPVAQVSAVETVKIVPKYITVYKERAKVELGLPASVQADPDKYVTAAGRLDAEARPYSLSAVFDAGTGQSTVYATPEPLPWVRMAPRLAVGLAYGLNESGAQVGELHARADLLQVKALRIGALGHVDTQGRAFAGVNLEWWF